MLEGKHTDLPPKPTFVEGWQLGQPDVILKAEKPYLLSATGSDQYWNFILPVPIHETRWVRAVEIRPGDKRLVHHANILVDRYESARRMEKRQGIAASEEWKSGSTPKYSIPTATFCSGSRVRL